MGEEEAAHPGRLKCLFWVLSFSEDTWLFLLSRNKHLLIYGLRAVLFYIREKSVIFCYNSVKIFHEAYLALLNVYVTKRYTDDAV